MRRQGDAWAERWQDLDRAWRALPPHLLSAVLDQAPPGPISSVRCGLRRRYDQHRCRRRRGRTRRSLLATFPRRSRVSRRRGPGRLNIGQVVLGDAEALAASEGPFDLFFSRHGVMFFPDPVRAFSSLRDAATPDAIACLLVLPGLVGKCLGVGGGFGGGWARDPSARTRAQRLRILRPRLCARHLRRLRLERLGRARRRLRLCWRERAPALSIRQYRLLTEIGPASALLQSDGRTATASRR